MSYQISTDQALGTVWWTMAIVTAAKRTTTQGGYAQPIQGTWTTRTIVERRDTDANRVARINPPPRRSRSKPFHTFLHHVMLSHLGCPVPALHRPLPHPHPPRASSGRTPRTLPKPDLAARTSRTWCCGRNGGDGGWSDMLPQCRTPKHKEITSGWQTRAFQQQNVGRCFKMPPLSCLRPAASVERHRYC